MSKTLKICSLTVAGMLAMGAAATRADCVYPKAPTTLPNGATASETEMTTAAAEFKQYDANVTAYLACLQGETAAKAAGVSPGQVMQIKSMQSKKHNAAVEELENNVARFNAQIRAYKSRKA